MVNARQRTTQSLALLLTAATTITTINTKNQEFGINKIYNFRKENGRNFYNLTLTPFFIRLPDRFFSSIGKMLKFNLFSFLFTVEIRGKRSVHNNKKKTLQINSKYMNENLSDRSQFDFINVIQFCRGFCYLSSKSIDWICLPFFSTSSFRHDKKYFVEIKGKKDAWKTAIERQRKFTFTFPYSDTV